MPLLRLTRRLLVAGSALFLVSTAAQAQVRYIASTGSDSGNNCASETTPCRTLQRGIGRTPVGGELRILDSGFYGNGGLIDKSMTISADGETVILSDTLTIDAAGSAVTLRGLSLNSGHLHTGRGINIFNAAAVHIDNCRVERFSGSGIGSSGNNTRLFVNDSISRENGASGLTIGGTSALLTVDNSRFENNRDPGITAYSGVVGSITRTVVSGNVKHGIESSAKLNVVSSVASNNGGWGYAVTFGEMHLQSSVAHGNGQGGLYVHSNSVASISNFVATDNSVGIENRGTVATRQNNTLYRNGTAVVGPQPVALPPL